MKIKSHYVVTLFPRSTITTCHLFTDSAYYMKSWQLENHVRGLTWLSGCAHIKRIANPLSQLVLAFQLSAWGTAVRVVGRNYHSMKLCIWCVWYCRDHCPPLYPRLPTPPAKPDSAADCMPCSIPAQVPSLPILSHHLPWWWYKTT